MGGSFDASWKRIQASQHQKPCVCALAAPSSHVDCNANALKCLTSSFISLASDDSNEAGCFSEGCTRTTGKGGTETSCDLQLRLSGNTKKSRKQQQQQQAEAAPRDATNHALQLPQLKPSKTETSTARATVLHTSGTFHHNPLLLRLFRLAAAAAAAAAVAAVQPEQPPPYLCSKSKCYQRRPNYLQRNDGKELSTSVAGCHVCRVTTMTLLHSKRGGRGIQNFRQFRITFYEAALV